MVFGPKIRMDLRTDKQVYLPGDLITTYINVYTDKPFKFNSALLEIVCIAKLFVRPVVIATGGSALVEKKYKTITTELMKLAYPINIPGNVVQPPGFSFTWPIKIPENALPTHYGSAIKITWEVRFVFSRGRLAGNIYQAAAFHVLQKENEELMRNPVAKKEIVDFGIAKIMLQKAMYHPGEKLHGIVEFVATEEMKIREIVATLKHVEEIGPAKFNGSRYMGRSEKTFAKLKLSKKIKVSPGDSLRLPFTLDIPPESNQKPSFITNDIISLWLVQITIPRRIFKDIEISIPALITNSYRQQNASSAESNQTIENAFS